MPSSSSQTNSVEALGALLSTIQATESRGVSAKQAGTDASSTQSRDSIINSQTRATPLPSKEALERLAEKLKELVGEDFQLAGQQAFNEDGLPIVEVSEPVVDSLPDKPSKIHLTEPPALRPPPKTEEERIARRRERDAFLDALEIEERLQEEMEREDRTLDDGQETEFMKAVRIAKERAQEIRTGLNTRANAAAASMDVMDGQSDSGESVPERSKGPKGNQKKSVSFASVESEESITAAKWGDVQMAKLRKPTLAAEKVRSGDGIMKLEIIERMPSASSSKAVSFSSRQRDSDDSDEDEEEDEEGEAIDADGDPSMQDATLQREVALRYHQLRQSLGAGPTGGALGGPVDPRNAWDQENVPLDASLAAGAKPSYPGFGTPRLNDRAIAAVMPQGLAGEIRQGPPEINVPEEDSDIGETGRRIIEGLKNGLTVEEVLANEPDMSKGTSSQPITSVKTGSAVLKEVTESGFGANQRSLKPVTSGSKVEKVSKFKADRLGQ